MSTSLIVTNNPFKVTLNAVDMPEGANPPGVGLRAGAKPCSKCKAAKPLTDFHRNRTKVGGLDTECRPCRAARKRFAKTSKPCIACRQRKPFSDFMRNRERRDGYDNKCKVCRKDHDRALALARVEEKAQSRKAIVHRQQLFHVPSPRAAPPSDARKPDPRHWHRISNDDDRAAAHAEYERRLAPPSCGCKCGRCVTATGTCLDG